MSDNQQILAKKSELRKNREIPSRERVIVWPEYHLLVQWCATPKELRQPETQRELARMLGVHEVTLSIWKKVEGFTDDVERKIKEWSGDFFPDVIQGVTKQAMKGNPGAARLFMEYHGKIKGGKNVLVPVQININEDRERYK